MTVEGRQSLTPLMFLSIRSQYQRLRIYGACARTRVVFKAARFGRLRLPANSAPLRGALRAAFERAAFPRGPLCPTKPRKVHGFQTKTKEYQMSKLTNRPSHRVYAVTKSGERSFWQPIGGAWVHNDGWGFNVKLDYLPLNGAEIVIRKPKVEEADAPAGEAA
jgi:hypothetical protein